jgi:hypothetical protein
MQFCAEVTEYQVTDGSQEYAVFYSIKDAEECVDQLNNKATISVDELRELGL